MKRALSFFLTCILLLGLLPTSALAADPPAEQFPTLTPGNTYWFDLSEEGIPGTVNTNVPDTTLHWVPFTYVGTVSAYVLTSRSADDETAKTDSENAANSTEPIFPGFTYDHSLFISDYNVTKSVSWDALNERNLIFGNGYSYTNNGVSYRMRAPSAGSKGVNNIGNPQNNEWDAILKKTINIKNWGNIDSWGQDTSSRDPSERALRGYRLASSWNTGGSATMVSTGTGFRPVLELQLGDANYLRVVTLDPNGGTLGTTAQGGPINIVVKDSFEAPGGEGLTPPEWKEFKNWKGSDGKTYDPGDRVPSSVTSLTAQWRTPLAVKEHPQSVFCSEGETATFTVEAVSDIPITYQWQVNKGNNWENISGADSSSYTVNAAEMNMNGEYRCDITAGSENVTSNEAMLTVDPNPSSLIPGNTYWFDLSGAGIPGTVNTGNSKGAVSVPDTTLHWVPFTYTGTINAYLLKSRSANDEAAKIDSDNAAKSRDPNNSIGYTCAHSLLIADYNVTKEVSWDELNAADMIFGKNYTSGGVSYKMRAPSAGSRPNVFAPDNWGIPQSNEWDRILNKPNLSIKNWSGQYSWGQDAYHYNSSEGSSIRGYSSVFFWERESKNFPSSILGFRPVLELQLDDVNELRVVTLDLSGGKIGSETGPINIVVKSGESFTAPGGEGLTPPEWQEFKNWKGSDGNSYAPGEYVPSSVTSLTAQWRTPFAVKEHPQSVFCSEGETATFTVEAVSDIPITYQWQVNKGNNWEDISGANSSSYTVDAAEMNMNGWEYRCCITAGSENETSSEAMLTVDQKSSSLIPGSTYWFDLSGAGIPGTVNTSVPNTTLHWVPFTYTGTINAYLLKSRSANDEAAKTDSDNAANSRAPDNSIGYTCAHSLLIADYNVTKDVSWNDLNGAGMIFGKDYASGGVNYTMRAPSAGNRSVRSDADIRATPQSNEWDRILNRSNSYIKNWKEMYSWGQDTCQESSNYSAVRGGNSVSYWRDSPQNYNYPRGFRPVLELRDPAVLTSGLQIVTLDLSGGKIGSETGPVNIVVKSGESFTAPGGEGLTAPDGKAFGGWKDSNTLYKAGETVPSSVTAMTAYWVAPPSITTQPADKTVSVGERAEFSIAAADESALTYQWQVSKDSGSSWEDISGATSSSYTTEAATADMNGWQYRCVASNSQGNATSDAATLTVKAPYQIAFTGGQADGPTQITLDAATVTPSGGTVTYAWNTANEVPAGGWQAGLVFSGLTAGTTYYFFAKAAASGNYLETVSPGVAITTPAKSVSGIQITAQPANLAYTSGQALDLSGLSVTVTYDDGTSETIDWSSGRLTASPAQGTALTVSEHDGNGVAISFGGKTANTNALTVTQGTQPPTKYLVTVNGGTGGGEYAAGDAVTITATIPDGKRFTGWTVNAGGVTLADPSSAKITFTMPAQAVTVTANFEGTTTPAIPVTSVKLNKTSTTLTVGGSERLTVTVAPSDATDKSVTWASSNTSVATVDSNGTVTAVSAGTVTITVTTVDGARTATCSVTVRTNSSGGGGGGGGGTTSTPSSLTVSVSGDKSTVHVSASVSGTTATVSKIDTTQIEKVIGDNGQASMVKIDFTGLGKIIDTVKLPAAAIKDIAVKAQNEEVRGLTVKLPDGEISFDAKALSAIQAQAGSQITLILTPAKPADLNSRQKEAVGSAPVFELTLRGGSGTITDFRGGYATVSLPYTLAAGQNPSGVVVYYLDSTGNITPCTTMYDVGRKSAIFTTGHLSLYFVGYDPTAVWVNPFSDVSEGAWYYDAVRFVSENGLMGGYGNGLFGVNDNISRAQLAQVLFNKEGRPVVNYLLQYGDVATGTWYTEAVRWATSQGIVGGYGNGNFGPNDPITLEQLAVMLWRYSGSPAATEKELRFSDTDKISDFALEAMRWAAENGIINGYGDGPIGPQGQTTRVQVAQILKNFFEKG